MPRISGACLTNCISACSDKKYREATVNICYKTYSINSIKSTWKMGNSKSKILEIIRDLAWFCVFAILISIVIVAIPAFGFYSGRYAIFSDILIGSAISFFVTAIYLYKKIGLIPIAQSLMCCVLSFCFLYLRSHFHMPMYLSILIPIASWIIVDVFFKCLRPIKNK